jgi:hypothetical protein
LLDQSTESEGASDDWEVPELVKELGVLADVEDSGNVDVAESTGILEEGGTDFGRSELGIVASVLEGSSMEVAWLKSSCCSRTSSRSARNRDKAQYM